MSCYRILIIWDSDNTDSDSITIKNNLDSYVKYWNPNLSLITTKPHYPFSLQFLDFLGMKELLYLLCSR